MEGRAGGGGAARGESSTFQNLLSSLPFLLSPGEKLVRRSHSSLSFTLRFEGNHQSSPVFLEERC